MFMNELLRFLKLVCTHTAQVEVVKVSVLGELRKLRARILHLREGIRIIFQNQY